MTKPTKGQLPLPITQTPDVVPLARARSSRQSPRGSGLSLIYALWITGKNWIKIGHTTDWGARRKHYQRSYGKEGEGFHVLVLMHGTWEEEQHIHYGVLYDTHPSHGQEYYAPTRDVTDAVHDLANGLHTNGDTYWESDDLYMLLSGATMAADESFAARLRKRHVGHDE